MKSTRFINLLAIVLISMTIGCDNFSNNNKDGETADTEIEGAETPMEIDQITYETANTRISKYNDIYGGVNAYQFLGASEDPNGSVIIPRYYVINRVNFKNMLEGSTVETIYASLSVNTQQFAASSSGYAYVSDLIFHTTKPANNGLLSNNGVGDTFYSYSEPCPVNCNPETGLGEGGTLAANIAADSIKVYNTIYSNNGHTEEYFSSGEDKVLIPRYYSVNRADIQEVLNSTTNPELYVSLGAEPVEGSSHTYRSDLIFHHVRPNPQGYLATSEDTFLDITKPCPDQCTE